MAMVTSLKAQNRPCVHSQVARAHHFNRRLARAVVMAIRSDHPEVPRRDRTSQKELASLPFPPPPPHSGVHDPPSLLHSYLYCIPRHNIERSLAIGLPRDGIIFLRGQERESAQKLMYFMYSRIRSLRCVRNRRSLLLLISSPPS